MISVPALVNDDEKRLCISSGWATGSVDNFEFNGYRVAYDIEFNYDGQTYEPTTYLAQAADDCKTGSASAFMSASTTNRDYWLVDSMAKDNSTERNAFNEKFYYIEGNIDEKNKVMDSNGNTVGTAYNEDKSTNINLNYSSTDSISILNSDNTRKVSTLETYNEDGEIYSDLLMTASTSEGGLTFPFDDRISLSNVTRGYDGATYIYTATYEYTKNINLGLVEREATDIALEKDLTEATVVINGQVLTYKFNSSIDFDSDEDLDLLYKQIAVADEEMEYTLGLYSSDYYYRASIYEDTDVETALNEYYGCFGLTASSLELEVYLKYTIRVTNESETYSVVVNGISDYYDKTFELVANEDGSYAEATVPNTESSSGVSTITGSTITYYNSDGDPSTGYVTWSGGDSEIKGSDGVYYNKITTSSIGNYTLKSGERCDIQVTFRIRKDTVSLQSDDDIAYSISNAIILGEKHNVAEITSFTSYYSDTSKNKWSSSGDVAGRIDEDSAPDNVNIESNNEKTWYEDDTDSAPIITVELVGMDREISGVVWEDAQTSSIQYGQTVGNGVFNSDEGDKTIAGMTTELVEVISIPVVSGTESGTVYYKTTDGGSTSDLNDENVVYESYDFIWPTDTTMIDSYSLETLTGFDSTITTNDSGIYTFESVPAGVFKVRFVYGDTKILTGNEDYEVVYNGQDYKSTSYQVGYNETTTTDGEETEESTTVVSTDSDGNGYTDNLWHDLENESLEIDRVSDARDSEARRLYITSKSEILTYDNTSILATADEDSDEDGYYDELFGYGYDESGNKISGYKAAMNAGDIVSGNTLDDDETDSSTGYYMYAETAWLDLNVEATYCIDEVELDSTGIYVIDGETSSASSSVGTFYTYNVDNIDFGIEERSQTKLTLDKQIKEITLTTSDGKVILDAIYNIEYELGDDDEVRFSVKLNKTLSTGYEQLASLNRTDNSQGYRYINVDSTILQGATITVQYQLTVFNVGEADTSSTALTAIWDANDPESALSDAISELTSNYNTMETRLISNGSDYATYEYGKYVGSIYYLGKYGEYFTNEADAYGNYTELAKTTVHQIIDYVDPDVEFIDSDNMAENQSWSTTTIKYLLNEGLIDPNAVILIKNNLPIYEVVDGEIVIRTYADVLDGSVSDSKYDRYTILNDQLQEYITDSKNNLILNVDSGEGGSGTNPDLVKETVPYTVYYKYDEDYAYDAGTKISESDYDESKETEYAYDSATASITLQVSRYYSSEDDNSDIDNIAEIIKVENTVGRRDIRNIAGNTVTYQIDQDEASDYNDEEKLTSTVSLYQIAGEEPDTSATEIITLSPPTGYNNSLKIILTVVGCLSVLAISIIITILVKKKRKVIK